MKRMISGFLNQAKEKFGIYELGFARDSFLGIVLPVAFVVIIGGGGAAMILLLR